MSGPIPSAIDRKCPAHSAHSALFEMTSCFSGPSIKNHVDHINTSSAALMCFKGGFFTVTHLHVIRKYDQSIKCLIERFFIPLMFCKKIMFYLKRNTSYSMFIYSIKLCSCDITCGCKFNKCIYYFFP